MNLLSWGVCKKPSFAQAEDLVGASNNFYWLLDGAASSDHELTCAYVHMLDDFLRDFSKSAKDPEDLLFHAIKHARMEYVDLSPPLPSSTAVIVQVLPASIRYLVLGDSFLYVRVGDKSVTISDNRLAYVAVKERVYVTVLRERGIPETSKKYIEARRALTHAEYEARNKPGGYWIAELNPDAAKESLTGTLPLPDLMVAATDGLERLVSVFNAYSDLGELGETILKKTDAYVFDQLRVLEKDPANYKRPVASQHDDAAYFLLSRK